MMDYETVRQRMEEWHGAARRARLRLEARRAAGGSRATARLAAGTALARVGLMLGGPAALRAALRSAR
jgi:hypothetical protein